MYDTILELGNGGLMSKKRFVEKYDLSCEGLSPKWVKVLRDITLEEINKFFGLVKKNGYSYEFTKDPIFIEKVERLWMVVHPKAYVLASRSNQNECIKSYN